MDIMDIIIALLGILIGLIIGGFGGWLVAKNYKPKETYDEIAEKEKEIRMQKQIENFWAYDGTERGQMNIGEK